MPDSKTALTAGIAKIWHRHSELVFRRVKFIADALHLLNMEQLPADLREQAGDDAHKLAGNLGSFGHPAGSEHARALEHMFLSEAQLTATESEEMGLHLNQLQEAVREIADAMAATNLQAVTSDASEIEGR